MRKVNDKEYKVPSSPIRDKELRFIQREINSVYKEFCKTFPALTMLPREKGLDKITNYLLAEEFKKLEG